MKRKPFAPDWFPVTVRKIRFADSTEYVMDYNSEENLFELTCASGKTVSYTFKQLGRLFAEDRYLYSGLGKDGFSRPVFTNKDEILTYAKENPDEKILAFSNKTSEVYSITGSRFFVNGEPVEVLPEGQYLLHPCTRFREFETEQATKGKSFPFWTAMAAFGAGVAASWVFVCYATKR